MSLKQSTAWGSIRTRPDSRRAISNTSEITCEQVTAAGADIARVADVFAAAEGSEGLGAHEFREADDGIERRPQFVAHIGQEFGFGEIGRLRLGLLLGVTVGQFGQLLRLGFEGLTGAAQIRDGRHQPALGIHQLFFVPLQRRDVGADRNIAAILGAPLVDLKPTAVAELCLVGARPAARVFAERNLRADQGRRGIGDQLRIGDADPDFLRRQFMQGQELRIAGHEAVVGVPQDESLRYGFDRVTQPDIGRGVALGQFLLVGDVDRDADEVQLGTAPFADQFGPSPQPDPFTPDVPQPKDVVDRTGAR